MSLYPTLLVHVCQCSLFVSPVQGGDGGNRPYVLRSLEPTTALEGQEVHLRVYFRGNPKPTARWFRNAVPIFDSDAYAVTDDGENSSVLVVKDPKQEDSGVFTCLLENISGAVKTSANLSVLAPAEDEGGEGAEEECGGGDEEEQYMVSASTVTTRTLKEMSVAEGDTIRFDIQFKDGDRSQLRFRKDGDELSEEGRRTKVSVDGEVAALTISDARAGQDSGLYECIMKTDGGEAKVQVKVEVKGGAKVEKK